MAGRLALVGANTTVGEFILEYLEEKNSLVDELKILASDPYECDSVMFQKKKVHPQDIAGADFSDIDIVIFADEESLVDSYAERAQQSNTFVIDSALAGEGALNGRVIVPEINGDELQTITPNTLLRNPNPASIFLSLVLAPLLKEVGLNDVNVCCHLPAVTKGKKGVEELVGQTARLLNGMSVKSEAFSQQLAFNLIPETSNVDELGFSSEEVEIAEQVREIFSAGDYALDCALSITCLQAPVFYGLSQAITIRTKEPLSAELASRLLAKSPSISVVSNDKPGPTAVKNASAKDQLWVGRVRQPAGQGNQIALCTVGESLRRGSAANSVQIAEILIKSYL